MIVTFNRPDDLQRMLTRLEEQSIRMDRLLVIDNASDSSVELMSREHGAEYIGTQENLGPAGGISLGMRRVLSGASPDDWLLLLDDDDPPLDSDAVRSLLAFGLSMLSKDPRTAGVGLVGAQYDRKRGVVVRVPDRELYGPVAVDHIGGNHLPMYRLGAVRDVGPFNSEFFFGFEELEFGLRLRDEGYRLYVDGDRWRRSRAEGARLGKGKTWSRASAEASAWRGYYSVRNSTLIARQFGGPAAVLVTAFGGGIKRALRLRRSGHPSADALLPLRGSIDGLLGRRGRRVEPQATQKPM